MRGNERVTAMSGIFVYEKRLMNGRVSFFERTVIFRSLTVGVIYIFLYVPEEKH